MNNGIAVGVEVPIATTLDECWQLVKTHEKTGIQCMLLENVCYREDVLTMLNMARLSLFGEMLYCHCGYQHDLSKQLLSSYYNDRWRVKFNKFISGDIYPTHGFGPVANILNINHKNRITKITSHTTKSIGLNKQAAMFKDKYVYEPFYESQHKNGDITTSTLETINGQNVVIMHCVTLARPYSLGFRIQGDNGLWMNDGNLIFLNKKPKNILNRNSHIKCSDYNYALSVFNYSIIPPNTFFIPHQPIFSIFNTNFTIKIVSICRSVANLNSFFPLKIGNLIMGDGPSQNYSEISILDAANAKHTVRFDHQVLPLNVPVERKIKIINENNIRNVTLWINNILIGTKPINYALPFYNNGGINIGDSNVNGWKYDGILNTVTIIRADIDDTILTTLEADSFNPERDAYCGCESTEIWESDAAYLETYKHPLCVKYINQFGSSVFHGGMDWYMMNQILESVRTNKPFPIDIYDSVTWSAIMALSEQSINLGSKTIDFPDFTNGKWMDSEPSFEISDYINTNQIHQFDKNIFLALADNSKLIDKKDVSLYENNNKFTLVNNIPNLSPGTIALHKCDDIDTNNMIIFDKPNQSIVLPLISNIKAISFWVYIDFTFVDELLYWNYWRYFMDARTGSPNSYAAIASYNLNLGSNIRKITINGVNYSTGQNINSIANQWVYVYIEFTDVVSDNINIMSRYTYNENLYGMVTQIAIWNKPLTDAEVLIANTNPAAVLPSLISYYKLDDLNKINSIADSVKKSANASLIGSPKWGMTLMPNKINTKAISELKGSKHYVLLFATDDGLDPRYSGKSYALY